MPSRRSLHPARRTSACLLPLLHKPFARLSNKQTRAAEELVRQYISTSRAKRRRLLFEYRNMLAFDLSVVIAVGPNAENAGSAATTATVTRSTLGGQTATLNASDGAPIHTLGRSVSISGSTTIVGARVCDNGPESGAAYIFERSGGTWRQVAKGCNRQPAGQQARLVGV